MRPMRASEHVGSRSMKPLRLRVMARPTLICHQMMNLPILKPGIRVISLWIRTKSLRCCSTNIPARHCEKVCATKLTWAPTHLSLALSAAPIHTPAWRLLMRTTSSANLPTTNPQPTAPKSVWPISYRKFGG